MSAMTPMRKLWWRFWWASPNAPFTYPGLYMWAFKRNVRVLPLPSFWGAR